MFANGSWVKIWECKKGNGNYYEARMSTSRKNQDGQYEQDWGDGRVRLVGTAAKQAENINDGDKLQIERCGVTNKYDKEKKVSYTNYVIFAFSNGDTQSGQNTNTKSVSQNKQSGDFMKVPDDAIDEELPFA